MAPLKLRCLVTRCVLCRVCSVSVCNAVKQYVYLEMMCHGGIQTLHFNSYILFDPTIPPSLSFTHTHIDTLVSLNLWGLTVIIHPIVHSVTLTFSIKYKKVVIFSLNSVTKSNCSTNVGLDSELSKPQPNTNHRFDLVCRF